MILAIDPGLATGIATLGCQGTFQSWIVPGGFDAMSDFLANMGMFGGIDAIAIENFIPRGGALTIQLDALHIIGAVKHECRMNEKQLLIQTPAQAKSFATNDKLKAAGWFNKGTEGHDNDAARHLMVAVVSGKIDVPWVRQARADVLAKVTA